MSYRPAAFSAAIFFKNNDKCFIYEKEEDYIELVEFEPKEETYISVSSLSCQVLVKDHCLFYVYKELGEESCRLVHSTSIVKSIQLSFIC